MFDHEVNEDASGVMGRRSALKKAAAAGVIVWAAPAIISDRALAVGAVCTPKCAPTKAGNVLVKPDVFCLPGNNGGKWLQITIGATGATLSTCPCQNGASATIVGTPTAVLSSGKGQIYSTSTSPTGVITIIIQGNGAGALGTGSYTVTLTVTQQCLDRSGRKVQQTCSYAAIVSFQPNNGSCDGSSTASVGTGSIGPATCTAAVCA